MSNTCPVGLFSLPLHQNKNKAETKHKQNKRKDTTKNQNKQIIIKKIQKKLKEDQIMTTTKEVKVHKQITTYSDICGHRSTVSLASVWDGENYKYQVIKTWNTFPKDPCVWQYREYEEALEVFKRIASEAAEIC